MLARRRCWLTLVVFVFACSSGSDPDPNDAGSAPDTGPGVPEFTADQIPVDCLPPDGTYQLDGEGGETIEAVITNGVLVSIGGEPCRFFLPPAETRTRRQILDDDCFMSNDWCRVDYVCDSAGLCNHETFIYQDDPDGAKWIIDPAANPGCARSERNGLDVWTIADAPCTAGCNGTKSCDGCGGDCQTGFKTPLGGVCDVDGDCAAGLRCVDWTGTDSFRCQQPCATHNECMGLTGLGGTQYRSCHSCTFSAGGATYAATNTCIPVLACGATGANGQTCSECLATCRGLTSCCTGVGCICEDAC